MFVEELNRLVDGHLQYIVDAFIVEFHFQRVGFEAFSMTRFTLQYQVCHKLHFYSDGSFSFTLFATSAFTIETEESGGISHLFRQRLFGP